ncbi:hypothetical protein FB567DRAFT_306081 [Paraphoma chrysanthemicola]|uniref:Uncharacterized protein n=1 Tax=Paraphoma chrysanthemicola TaxID=798071 RepID=A0A8K0RC72_9PLEO|nr:hypothetical protein FB567DRAFT_306081 [Paraphoma chrysanthemicola]
MRPSKRVKTCCRTELQVTIKQEAPPSPRHTPKPILDGPGSSTSTEDAEDRKATTGRIDSLDPRIINNEISPPISDVDPAEVKATEAPPRDYSWLYHPKRTCTLDPTFSTDYLVGWIWDHGAPVMKPGVKYQQGLFWLCRHCFQAPPAPLDFDITDPFEALKASIMNDINSTEYSWSLDSGFGGALAEYHLMTRHDIYAPSESAKPGLFETLNLIPTNTSHVGLIQRLETMEEEIAAMEQAFKSGVKRWKEEKECWLEGMPSKTLHRELCKKAKYKIYYR